MVDACEKKKNGFIHQTVLVTCVADVEAIWPVNANAPRLDVVKSAKRQRHMTFGQVGGVSRGLIVGIGKAGYAMTKSLGEHQTKRAKKISEKRRREVDESYARGKPKRYAGESFNCSIM